MVFVRSSGAVPFHQLRRGMDQMLEDLFAAGAPLGRALNAGRAFPVLNVWEQGDSLFAEAELPGVAAEDVEVSVVGNELSIKGRRSAAQDEGTAYHRRERGTGEFARVVQLPVDIDAEKVEATLANGVLTIKLPKSAAAKPHKVQINTR